MLKKTINYTNFDDEAAVETVYFNLTKTDLADNMHVIEEFEALRKLLSGPKRDLKVPEIQMIINMVKKVMQMSYGIRSEDGKRFVKTDQQWVEFTQTAVYDEFLISLFENPENAVDFVSGIIPKDMREKVIADANKAVDELDAAVPSTAPPVTVTDYNSVPENTPTVPPAFNNPGLTPAQMEAATQDYMRKNGLN